MHWSKEAHARTVRQAGRCRGLVSGRPKLRGRGYQDRYAGCAWAGGAQCSDSLAAHLAHDGRVTTERASGGNSPDIPAILPGCVKLVQLTRSAPLAGLAWPNPCFVSEYSKIRLYIQSPRELVRQHGRHRAWCRSIMPRISCQSTARNDPIPF